MLTPSRSVAQRSVAERTSCTRPGHDNASRLPTEPHLGLHARCRTPRSCRTSPHALSHESAGTFSDRDATGCETRSIVGVAEWHCTGNDVESSLQSAELSPTTYDIVVTRRGAYVRHCDGDHVLSHCGVATFWHPDSVYRVSHPIAGGDVCSVFRLPAEGVRAIMRTYDPAVKDREVLRFPANAVVLDGLSYLAHRVAIAKANLPASVGSNGRTNVAPSELTDPLALEESAVAFVHAALARATAVSSHVQRQRRMGVAEAKNRYAADYAQRVHEVIAQRFHEPVTLNLIATEVGCSPYHSQSARHGPRGRLDLQSSPQTPTTRGLGSGPGIRGLTERRRTR